MLKTILVGLNGSAASRSAGELAKTWAKQHGAQVLAVSVAESSAPNSGELFSSGTPSGNPLAAESSDAHRHDRGFLVEFEWSCLSSGLPITIAKEGGDAGTVLLRQSQCADLMVVGLNRNPQATVLSPFSTTLDRVLTNAIHPVVCVPPMYVSGRSVLVAYDGSLQAARTLFAFVSLGLFSKELVRLVAVEEIAGEHAEALAFGSKYLTNHGYRTQTDQLQVQTGGVAETLRRHVATVNPALVVLGVFGQNWSRPVLCGSVTKRLLHEDTVPVFVYH